ncbi:hypothetical protein KCU92_g7613, partial [Aureobasidium melanogenum]
MTIANQEIPGQESFSAKTIFANICALCMNAICFRTWMTGSWKPSGLTAAVAFVANALQHGTKGTNISQATSKLVIIWVCGKAAEALMALSLLK